MFAAATLALVAKLSFVDVKSTESLEQGWAAHSLAFWANKLKIRTESLFQQQKKTLGWDGGKKKRSGFEPSWVKMVAKVSRD